MIEAMRGVSDGTIGRDFTGESLSRPGCGQAGPSSAEGVSRFVIPAHKGHFLGQL
jgi:hypothetical protein